MTGTTDLYNCVFNYIFQSIPKGILEIYISIFVVTLAGSTTLAVNSFHRSLCENDFIPVLKAKNENSGIIYSP